jgi:hypothetical protein
MAGLHRSTTVRGLITRQLVRRGMVLVGGDLIVVYLVSLLRSGASRRTQRTISVLDLGLLVF